MDEFETNKEAFSFLTEIYEIMKCFENNPSKITNKLNELKGKFEKARATLMSLPGIDMSHQEQQEYYESLLKQYQSEKELLKNYQEMCKFDISQLEKGPSENFLNQRGELEPGTSAQQPSDVEPKLENFAGIDPTPKFDENQLFDIKGLIRDENNFMELENYPSQNLNPRSNF